ncbi:hypothetical protein ONZ45_g13152 [Pleurotus djamor]|nr:hypothetical protein ONZ45_g13152 [Pleurotus djamor]
MPQEYAYPDVYHEHRRSYAIHLLPYLRNAHARRSPTQKAELRKYFKAAIPCMLDRFPLPRRGSKPCSKARLNHIKRNFVANSLWSLAQSRFCDVPPCEGDWRAYMNLEADRERRRQRWLLHGEGQPRQHQFIVAFPDYRDQYDELLE